MNESIINVRYARALFSLAKEKGLLETTKADIETVVEVSNKSDEFRLFLESPVVKTSKKINLLNQIFSGSIHELTLNFLILITENRRETLIPDICRNFLDLLRKDMGIKTAVITTATPLPGETLKKARVILEKEFNTKIELSGKVNPEILGGIVLRVEDRQYDASIASQLKKIKTTFLETEINQIKK
jgi:F-type H+-transporting ATPase subunit delta